MTKRKFGGEPVAVAAEEATACREYRVVYEDDGGAVIITADGMHLGRVSPAGVNRGFAKWISEATPKAVVALLSEYDAALAKAEGCGETDPGWITGDWPLPPGYEAALHPHDESGRMVGASRCDPLRAEIVP